MLFFALLTSEPPAIGKGALPGILLGLLILAFIIFLNDREFFSRFKSKSSRSDISEDEVFNFLVQLNKRSTVSAQYVARGLKTQKIDDVLEALRSLAAQGKIRRTAFVCSGTEEFGLLR